MAKDTKGNLFEKVEVVNGITFVREFRPYSDDAEWGNVRYYSIYAGDVIVDFELGVFALGSWVKLGSPEATQTGSWMNLLEQKVVPELKARTKQRIKELADLVHAL
jgi:hypothetical protein